MNKIKNSNVIIYTLVGFAPLSFSLLFTPVYTHYLSKEQYGLLNLFNTLSGLWLPLMGLGIDQAFSFLYWDYYKDKVKLRQFLYTTCFLIMLVSFIVILLSLIFGKQILNLLITNDEDFKLWPFLILAFIYPLFMILNRILTYLFRNGDEVKKFVILNLGSLTLITIGSILGIIVFDKGAEGAVIGRTIGFVALVSYFIVKENFGVKRMFGFDEAKILLKLGLPLFVATIVGSVSYMADRMVLERFGNLGMLGIYGLAITVSSVLEVLLNSLGNSFIPSIYKTISENHFEKYDQARRYSVIFYLIMVICISLVIAISYPLITIFIPSEYHESLLYMPILCAAYIPRSYFQFYSLMFYKGKKTHFLLFVNLLYLVIVGVFSYFLFDIYGIGGICLAVYAASLSTMVLAMYLSKKVGEKVFDFKKTYLLSFLVSVSVLFSFLFNSNINYLIWLNLFPLLICIILVPILFTDEYNLIVKKSKALNLFRYNKL